MNNPTVKPTVKPGKTKPNKKDIWRPKPSYNPKPKMQYFFTTFFIFINKKTDL